MNWSKMNFRNALKMAHEIGGEKVANLDTPSTGGEKRNFNAYLSQETKQDIIEAAEVISWDNFTENEKDALLFAYCAGWTAEVRCHNGITKM